MKVYPHDTLQIMMESALIAEGLHSKGTPRKQEYSTYHAKQKANSNQGEAFSRKRPQQPGGKNEKKPEGTKKSKFLSPSQIKAYMEEGKCFYCGEKGHRKPDCPQLKKEPAPPPPSSNSVP